MNSAFNAAFSALDSKGPVCENNTPVFKAWPLLIFKKSKGVTATPVHPNGEKIMFLDNNVKKTPRFCGFEVELFILWVFTAHYRTTVEWEAP